MLANYRFNVNRHVLLAKLAVIFLTRLPIKIEQDVSDEDLNQATGYFPVVGLLVALLFCLVFFTSQLLIPISVSLVIAMIASLFLTGCFHEDGLADTADGLGGGWTVENKLSIMKDSRLGTYGASALFCSLLLKFTLLNSIAEVDVVYLFVAVLLGHVFSRAFAVSIISKMDYVQLDATSKTKPVAKSLSAESFNLILFTSALVAACLWLFTSLSLPLLAFVFAGLLLSRQLFIGFIFQQLGGYTGDVLGAAQQVFELVIYVVVLAYVF